MSSGVYFTACAWLLIAQCALHVRACRFPEFVQDRAGNGTVRREWYGHVTNQHQSGAGYSTVTKIGEYEMQTVVYSEDSNEIPTHQSWICLLENEGRYLVEYREEDVQIGYKCIQFISRSEIVMQITESEVSSEANPIICNRDMVSNKWPFVNRVGLDYAHHDCPITGGYNVFIFDKLVQAGLCDVVQGHTRVEIGCQTPGEMHFIFREQKCIPTQMDLSVYQKTYCIGMWYERNYIFTVLRHDRLDRFWCLRINLQKEDQFTAILFRDLFCDFEDRPADNTYLVFSFVKNQALTMNTICMDEYEACDLLPVSSCQSESIQKQLMCAKRCGVCNSSRPRRCQIPARFHGSWAGGDTQQDIVVNEYEIVLPGRVRMECVDWGVQTAVDAEGSAHRAYIELMFVETYDAGCRPKYSCVRLKANSPSVMRIKQSVAQKWPFRLTNTKTIDCAGFDFLLNNNNPNDGIQNSHYTTLMSMSRRRFVDCELEETKYFTVTYSDATSCNGYLTQEGIGARNKFKLVLNRCNNYDGQIERVYACLDSDKHHYNKRQLLVTETLDNELRTTCWYFPPEPQNQFYLVSVTNCTEAAGEAITTNQITPLAMFQKELKFRIVPVLTQPTTTPTSTIGPTSPSPSWSPTATTNFNASDDVSTLNTSSITAHPSGVVTNATILDKNEYFVVTETDPGRKIKCMVTVNQLENFDSPQKPASPYSGSGCLNNTVILFLSTFLFIFFINNNIVL